MCLHVGMFVCLFLDTKMSALSEKGQFMSSTYYVRVRSRAYMPHERERTSGGQEKQTFQLFGLRQRYISI